MTKFLLDANLSPRLAARIGETGHECVHVSEFIAPHASDLAVARVANSIGAALVTRDADFHGLALHGILQGPQVRLRIGNMSNRQTLMLLIPAMPQTIAAIEAGETIVEIQ